MTIARPLRPPPRPSAQHDGATIRDQTPPRLSISAPTASKSTPRAASNAARWLLAADGATGIAARSLQLAPAAARSAAYELEIAAPPDQLERWRNTANVDVGYRPWGYGWVFPKQGRLSVGVVAAPRRGRDIRRQADQYPPPDSDSAAPRSNRCAATPSATAAAAMNPSLKATPSCSATPPAWPTNSPPKASPTPSHSARLAADALLTTDHSDHSDDRDPGRRLHRPDQPHHPTRTRRRPHHLPPLLLVPPHLALARPHRLRPGRLLLARLLPHHARRQHLRPGTRPRPRLPHRPTPPQRDSLTHANQTLRPTATIARLLKEAPLTPWRPTHGPRHRTRPHLLSQNTSDTNSGRAFQRLLQRYPDWDAVLTAPVSEIEDAIRPGGLAKTKAPRIQALLAQLRERLGPRLGRIPTRRHADRRRQDLAHLPARRRTQDRRLRPPLLARTPRPPRRHPCPTASPSGSA